MRIAIIAPPFVPVPPPAYGGTELVIGALAEELVRRGHEVVLYATGDSRVPGVEVRYTYQGAIWPPDPWHELNQASFAVRDILASDGIDVVHTHVPASVALAPFGDLPVVYTIHHAEEAALAELYRGSASSNLTLVAISGRQRELLGDGLAAEVVHHGLRPDLYPLGRGGGGAAFVGRFAEEKGVHRAIDVAARARVKLRLAGRPHWKDEAYFRGEVEARLRQPHVTWIGEAGLAAKVRLLGGAFATLVPIDWEEPFGLVMIESMLCGTPVIALERGSAAELIEEGVTGWVVSSEDEMVRRLTQLASGRRRFDRARCRAAAVRRFSVERMAREYLALYAAALGQARIAGQVLEWPAS